MCWIWHKNTPGKSSHMSLSQACPPFVSYMPVQLKLPGSSKQVRPRPADLRGTWKRKPFVSRMRATEKEKGSIGAGTVSVTDWMFWDYRLH